MSRAKNISNALNRKSREELENEFFDISNSLINKASDSIKDISNKMKTISTAAKMFNTQMTGAMHTIAAPVIAASAVADKITRSSAEQRMLAIEHQNMMQRITMSKTGASRTSGTIGGSFLNSAKNLGGIGAMAGAGLTVNHLMNGGTGLSPGATAAFSLANPVFGAMSYGGGMAGFGANAIGGAGKIAGGLGMTGTGDILSKIAGMGLDSSMMGIGLTIGTMLAAGKGLKWVKNSIAKSTDLNKNKENKSTVRATNISRMNEANPIHMSMYRQSVNSARMMGPSGMAIISADTEALLMAIHSVGYNTAYTQDILDELRNSSNDKINGSNRALNKHDELYNNSSLSLNELNSFKKEGRLTGMQRASLGIEGFLQTLSEFTNFSNLLNTKSISEKAWERRNALKNSIDPNQAKNAVSKNWKITNSEVDYLHNNLSSHLIGSFEQNNTMIMMDMAFGIRLSARKLTELARSNKDSASMLGDYDRAKKIMDDQIQENTGMLEGYIQDLDKMISRIPIIKVLSGAGHLTQQLISGSIATGKFFGNFKENMGAMAKNFKDDYLDKFRDEAIKNKDQLAKEIGAAKMSPEALAFEYLGKQFRYDVQELLNYSEGSYANLKAISGVSTENRDRVLDETTGRMVSRKVLKRKSEKMIKALEDRMGAVNEDDFSMGSWLTEKIFGIDKSSEGMKKSNLENYKHLGIMLNELGQNGKKVSHKNKMLSYSKIDGAGQDFKPGSNDFPNLLLGAVNLTNTKLDTINDSLLGKNKKIDSTESPLERQMRVDMEANNKEEQIRRIQENENHLNIKSIYELLYNSKNGKDIRKGTKEDKLPGGEESKMPDILGWLFGLLPDNIMKKFGGVIKKGVTALMGAGRFLFTPQGLLIAGAAVAVGGIIYGVYNYWDEIKDAFGTMTSWLSDLFVSAKSWVTGTWDRINAGIDQFLYDNFGIGENKKPDLYAQRQEQLAGKINSYNNEIQSLQDPRERFRKIGDINTSIPLGKEESKDHITAMNNENVNYANAFYKKQFGIDLKESVKNGLSDLDKNNLNKMTPDDIQRYMQLNSELIKSTSNQEEKNKATSLHKELVEVFKSKRDIELKEQKAQMSQSTAMISKGVSEGVTPVIQKDNKELVNVISDAYGANALVASSLANLGEQTQKQFGMVTMQMTNMAQLLKEKETFTLDNDIISMIPSLNSVVMKNK